jgi:hypothetical protein
LFAPIQTVGAGGINNDIGLDAVDKAFDPVAIANIKGKKVNPWDSQGVAIIGR